MFPPVFAYKVCLRGTCPRKHKSVTRRRFFRLPNGGFPFFDGLKQRPFRSLFLFGSHLLPVVRGQHLNAIVHQEAGGDAGAGDFMAGKGAVVHMAAAAGGTVLLKDGPAEPQPTAQLQYLSLIHI